MSENHDCSFGLARPARSRSLAFALGMSLLGLVVSGAFAAEGVPVNGQPSYQERAVLTLTNAVRMAPSQYRDTYLPAGNSSILTGSGVAPLYWNAQLNIASRNHAVDMATHNYFSHVSQDGTTWVQRIANAGYTGSPTGENIAAGYQGPLEVMVGWLLSQGHRDNIMSTASRELGIGYAFSSTSTYGKYWVQDMGTRNFTVTSPVVAGSHVFPSTGNVRFLVDMYEPSAQAGAPQSVKLVVQGTAYAMNLHMGAAARGTYEKTMATSSGCRPYHFEVVSASGTTWRYPSQGEYMTYGENGCNQDYQAGSTTLPGDVNGNGIVNVDDLMAVIAAWGACPPAPNPCPADLAPTGGNGAVGPDDLLVVINHWS